VLHCHDLPAARAKTLNREHPLLKGPAHARDCAGKPRCLDIRAASLPVGVACRVPFRFHALDAASVLGGHPHHQPVHGSELMGEHLLERVCGPDRFGRV
jgi:hypothetical protein